jgi:hypothetical protein
MNNNVVLTSNLSGDLALWLDSEARTQKVTKRAILENALREYRVALKKQKLKETFLLANGDFEVMDLAEDGLGDYLLNLNE